ncbi:MAG: M20 family metallopeptidase [Candidatus Omnitrophica bacterium]|nr:M20 family metallopeptidase [Candidatus Omnitrophota bacterium]
MINRSRLIKLTQKVLSIDSQNPPGNEVAIADFVVKDMRDIGLDVRVVSYAKDRPNVLATWRGSLPRKQAASQALLITPHTDTVPVGKGWKFDPFGKDISGGKIYGRGASDDKGNLACAMEALRSLREEGYLPKKDIVLAATADEETGSHMGIKPLLNKGVLRPGLALVLDSVDFDTVIAQKGLFHSRIRVFGKKAHGATNWLGVNAIELAAKIIRKLKKHECRFRKHALLNHPTVNIGTIRGGDKVNMVADFCEFSVDIRYMPGTDPKKVVKQVQDIVDSVAEKSELVIDDLQLPYEIDRDDAYVAAFLRAAKKCGQKARLQGSDGATVISFFQHYNIPAFATGFGKSGTLHADDEYAEVKTLCNGARVLEEFIRDYDQI